MEAMVLGKPFLMYEGEILVDKNDDVADFLERFSKAGIYYKSIPEIAEVLNNPEKLETILSNPNTQELYRDYMKTFAGADKDLEDSWYEEFLS
jgi:hypothetical protein